MIERPTICVVRVDGINCNNETAAGLEQAGANARQFHINEIKANRDLIRTSNGLIVSGGFSYGDDIRAGIAFATELTTELGDETQELLERNDTVVGGICNGFQVLVEAGVFPFGGKVQKAALLQNQVGHFVCDVVNLKVEKTASPLLRYMPDYVQYHVAHGEGRFVASDETLTRMEALGLVAFRYVDKLGNPTMDYPDNPNGAMDAIAGIVNPKRNAFAMMPHPERSLDEVRDPNWRRRSASIEPPGRPFFRGVVDLINQS